jgi:hypothetical protein
MIVFFRKLGGGSLRVDQENSAMTDKGQFGFEVALVFLKRLRRRWISLRKLTVPHTPFILERLRYIEI